MNVYGLIGYPLGHSFSKKYFTEKFEREGISDSVFEAFPIPSVDEFPALLKDNPDLKGLCVTIPYKQQVLQYVNELSEEVKAIGATNSILIRNDKLIAYNTDITGFRQSFQKLLQPHHTKALVLGTGGASKAVQYVLRQLKIDFLVVTRSVLTAKDFISYKDINEYLMSEYSIIINCTPVGMWPNENDCPDLPYQLINSSHYLYDLVYKPEKTLFLQKGENNGAVTQNGYEMLIIQAEESWRIWHSY
jgi:shikimate dehydrogenase